MRKAEKWHLLPLIICVLTLAACFVPYQGGQEGTFTIVIGTPKNSRSPLPWDEEVQIENLTHTIELSGGPGNGQFVTVTGSQTVPFAVEPGKWTITVKAYLSEEYELKNNEAHLKAEGSESVEIKPGRNGAITITMRRPGGEAQGEEPLTPDGTTSNPYLINTVEDLSHVGKPTIGGEYDNWTLDKHYKQMADITLSDVPAGQSNWTPIGELHYSDPGKDDFEIIGTPFTGSYDGNGHTIGNLKIDTSADFQGLFGGIAVGAIVKNIGIVNCDITSSALMVGGVVGYNGGTVQNCIATGNVTGTGAVGGVVGNNGYAGTVQNCYATVNVTGTLYSVGGVVGANNGTMKNCLATGDVSGTGDNVGGVAGQNNGPVQNCYATGNVSGAYYVGGVVGLSFQMSSTSPLPTVQNCYSTGNVSGSGQSVGGVVGQNGDATYPGGTVENCYATGDVSGTGNYVGGVAGYSFGTNAKVQNCVALNPNISYSSVGSFVGGRVLYDTTSGTMTNNYGRSDMKNNSAATTWTPDVNGKDGANITATDWGNSTWWTDTALFNAEYWDCSDVGATKLPTLKGMPGAAQTPVVKPN